MMWWRRGLSRCQNDERGTSESCMESCMESCVFRTDRWRQGAKFRTTSVRKGKWIVYRSILTPSSRAATRWMILKIFGSNPNLHGASPSMLLPYFRQLCALIPPQFALGRSGNPGESDLVSARLLLLAEWTGIFWDPNGPVSSLQNPISCSTS